MTINQEKLKMSEDMLQIIINSVGPDGLATALNNVSCHGQCFEKADLQMDSHDKLLQEWFKGIELLQKSGKKIRKFQ